MDGQKYINMFLCVQKMNGGLIGLERYNDRLFFRELSLKMNFVYTELLVIPTNPSVIHCTSRNSHEFGGSVFLILLVFICHLIFTWHFLKLAWFL